jgi:Tfp pilus assembly protein PilN
MSARTAVQEAPVEVVFNPAALGAAQHPQVNLLPPEVRSRRALGRVKVRLGVFLLVVVLALGGGFVYAMLARVEASDRLTTAQGAVDDLTAQQAKYSDVPLVKNGIARAESARQLGTSTEVLWADYLRAIQAIAPAGWTISTLSTTMPTPVGGQMGQSNPLAGASVGQITFSGRAPSVPDVAAWQDALASVPGFSDPYVTVVQSSSDQNGSFYQVTSTVNVDETAFAHRYATQEGQS